MIPEAPEGRPKPEPIGLAYKYGISVRNQGFRIYEHGLDCRMVIVRQDDQLELLEVVELKPEEPLPEGVEEEPEGQEPSRTDRRDFEIKDVPENEPDE